MVISHSFIVPDNRSRWRQLARRHKDVQVRLITVKNWVDRRHGAGRMMTGQSERSERFEVMPLPVWNPGDITGYTYRSIDLTMRAWKPDVIQVNQERVCYSVFQTLFYKRIWAPQAMLVHGSTATIRWHTIKFTHWLRQKLLFHLTQAYTVNSQRAARLLIEQGYWKPICIMPDLGLDEEIWCPGDGRPVREKLGLRGFVIGYAGALEWIKGVQDILEAASRVPGECDILMVGDGPTRAELESRAATLPATHRLILAGYVPKEEMPDYYRAMDLFVIASRTTATVSEQFGWVLAEAMACGVPALCSDSGEMHEVVGDKALVFPEGDVEALATLIRRFKDDQELRERYRLYGRQRALENFTASVLADRSYDFYCELLAQRQTG